MQIEHLRQQAERETDQRAKTRRPSWAPALVLTGELLEVCRSLEWLGPEDKPVARLWAIFADPKKLGTWQRDHLSEVPLHGHRVRGFELIPGEQRTGTHRIYRTLKNQVGDWDEGPYWEMPSRKTWPDARSTERSIALYTGFLQDRISDEARQRYEAAIAELEAKRAAAQGKLEAEYARRLESHQLRRRSFELAKARIAEFLGDPEGDMRAGSQVTGKCSRELSPNFGDGVRDQAAAWA
jgi:hypothetical protein